MLASNLPDAPVEERNELYVPLFCPRTFSKAHQPITLEEFAIDDADIQKYGMMTTTLRTKILDRAEAEQVAAGAK